MRCSRARNAACSESAARCKVWVMSGARSRGLYLDPPQSAAVVAERVIAFVRVFEDRADELMAAQSSCLYVSVLTERQLAQSGTWDQITRAVVAWRTELSRMLNEALKACPGAGAVDTGALADHVFVTFEGAFILARSMNDASHMRAQLRVLRQLLEALLSDRQDPGVKHDQ